MFQCERITKQRTLPGSGFPKQCVSIIFSADNTIIVRIVTNIWKKKQHDLDMVLDEEADELYHLFDNVQFIVQSESKITSERKTLYKIEAGLKAVRFLFRRIKNLRRAVKATLKNKSTAAVAGVVSAASSTTAVASQKSLTSWVMSDQKRSSSTTSKSKQSTTVTGVASTRSDYLFPCLPSLQWRT